MGVRVQIRSGSSLCELITEACDATTPVGLRPLGKHPCHLTLGRDAHSVAPLVVAPLTFPRCWNHCASDGAPTRLGTHRCDQAVFTEAKQQRHCGFAVLQSCIGGDVVYRFPLHALAWQE